MTKKHLPTEGKAPLKPKPEAESRAKDPAHQPGETEALTHLQQQVGNQAVQRLILQRSGNEAVDLDEETADQINQARGGGQPLDSQVQKQMGDQFGQDFSDVRTHTSPKADELNKDVGAEAFTTGKDIFFREGAYDPNSGSGKKLIAHELTHVVQQSQGSMGSTAR